MKIYRAAAHDCLRDIARTLGVSPLRLSEINGHQPDDILAEGEAVTVLPAASTYTVKKDDELRGISRRFHLPLCRLYQQNPSLGGQESVYPGQTLTLATEDQPEGALSVIGFSSPGDLASLPRILPYLTYLVLCGGGVFGEYISAPGTKEAVRQARAASVMPLLGISSGDGHQTADEEREELTALLRDAKKCDAFAERLINVLKNEGYGGVYLDFSFLPPEIEESYTAFVIWLRRRLRAAGGILFIGLCPRGEKTLSLSPGQNYERLGRAAGGILLQTYDLLSPGEGPAPVCPADRLADCLAYASARIRPSKLFLGLPFCGSCHTLASPENTTHPEPEESRRLIAENRAKISFDRLALVPYAAFSENGQEKILYYEDAESLSEKLRLAARYRVAGIGLYPLTTCDPAMLSTLCAMFRIVKGYGG